MPSAARRVAGALAFTAALASFVSAQPAERDLAAAIRLLDEGDLPGAVDALGVVVRTLSGQRGREKDLGRAHLHLGIAYALVGEDKAARANFREALKADAALALTADRYPAKVLRLFRGARQDMEAAEVEARSAISVSSAPPAAAQAVRNPELSIDEPVSLRSPDGATYIAGLLRLRLAVAPGNRLRDGPGHALVKVALKSGDGVTAGASDREATGEITSGSMIVSYGLTVRPGRYLLDATVTESSNGQVATATLWLDAPDLGGEEVAVGALLPLAEIQEGRAADPQHPMAAFQLGSVRLVPRFGNVFSRSDSLNLMASIYNGRVDPSSDKRSITTDFTILLDGKPVAKGATQTFDATPAAASVGPVPLTTYKPGRYVVELKVRDAVSGREYTRQAAFEVR